MIRKFKNEETDETIEKDFPIKEEIPREITHEGKVYKFVSEFGGASIHIPLLFRSAETESNRPNYKGYGPRGRKRVW